MPTAVQKICASCGIDVCQQKRVKDPTGRYYCHPCWRTISQATSADNPAGSGPAASLNSSERTTPNDEAVKADKLTGGERRLIFTGVVVGVLVIVGVVYFVIGRTWWEDHNRRTLLTLKEGAETLVRQGKLEDAKSQYGQFFKIVGDHPIRGDDLKASIKTAHDDADKVAFALMAQDQTRKEADRRQQEAQAEQERQSQTQAAERAKRQQAAWDAQGVAFAKQKDDEEKAKAQQAAAADEAWKAARLEVGRLMLNRADAEFKYIKFERLANQDEREGTQSLKAGRGDDASAFFKQGLGFKNDAQTLLQTITDLTEKISKYDPALVKDAHNLLLLAPPSVLHDDFRPYVEDDDFWMTEDQKCQNEFSKLLDQATK